MMTFLVMEKGKLFKFLILFFVIAICTALLLQWPTLHRKMHGVKEGVTLENLPVEGLLPEELREMISDLAKKYSIEPRNAGIFPETGELIPERDGLGVDVDATISSLLDAKTGENVHLITYSIPATVSKEFFTPVFQGDTERKEVSLTINVAWGEEVLPEMLEIFDRNKVKATFFFVGDWVKKFPEMTKDVSERGHEVANHGLYHGHPNQMSKDELTKLVLENSHLLSETTGKPIVKFFAPPYGEFNEKVVAIVGSLGYRTIMWSVDTIDWKRPAPEIIINRVVSKIKPGGIVLMHPTAPTVAALNKVITSLKSKGFNIVTISQLLRE